MNKQENIGIDFIAHVYSNDSHLNLAGKILLTPIILLVGGIWTLLDFLFTKRK